MNTPEQIFIVKRAILDSFLSLTEQPVIYKYVKGGIATSGKKPIFRNNNGDLIAPVLPEDPLYNPDKYDPHPMAVKFAKKGGNFLLPKDSDYNTADEFYIRFTDFTLDGASKAYYFYYACEITNQLTIGKVDNIIGPVLMVNTAPAEAPGIREVRTILANPVAGDVTSVLFKLNPYNKSEGITQFWIYRAYDAADASNIRSMHPPVKVDANKEVIDSFSDLAFPPYGETLFYRIVAIRRIKNELSKDEDILSLPSKLVQTSIVDVINPLAPKLMAKNGLTTPTALQNVLLKWNATAYNGAYYLQKQNASGNWVEVYRTKVKDAAMQYPPLNANNLPDFANFSATQNLPRVDSDGNAIYHRFRVQVENASGLFNLSEFELTLAKGASDLQETNSVLSFADGNNHQMTVLSSSNIVAGASQPGQMTFTHRNNVLPAGHNTFNKIEITVSDDLGKSFTKDISTPAGKVVFHHGDGGLIMDASKPNRVYTIRTKLFTDYAPNGAVQVFTVNYLSGACNNLKTIKSLIQITDDTHDFDPSATSTVNDGVSCPKVLKIAASTQFLALGQTLVQMVITIKDDLGNTAIKTITQTNTQVIFDQNDSLVLDASNPNRSYEIQVNVSTLECSQDRAETYRIFYSCPPSNELAKLKDIAQFVDNNQTNLQLIVGENLKAFAHANGKITIYEMISGNLPAGHQFISMEVILKDDIGNQSKDTIQNAGDSVVFHHVEGGLWLNYSNISRVYFITLVLRTNLSPDSYNFTVKY